MNFSFEGVSANHRIVSVKFGLSLCRNKKKTHQSVHYDLSSLVNSNICNHSSVMVRNKFDTFQETSERLTPMMNVKILSPPT